MKFYYTIIFLLPFIHAAPSPLICLALRQLSMLLNSNTIFTCPAASWPPAPSSINTLNQPQPLDHDLQTILSSLDPARIDGYIRKLVSFSTRHTLSTQTDPNRGIGAARDWIASQMRELAAESDGRMELTVPSYIQGVGERIPFPVRISNVIATLKGCVDPGRVYVVSGHYDTRVTNVLNYTADGPGAEDECETSTSPHRMSG